MFTGSGLRWLATALVIILIIAYVLYMVIHLKSSKSSSLINITSNVPVSVNVPVYVIGSALVRVLVGLGFNASLIRLINVSGLLVLPNGSVVIIDWSVIKPNLIINNSGGKITVNLTSPIIHDLAKAIAKDDVIGIYANGSNENTIEFILAYSWTLASGNRLRIMVLNQYIQDYLIAYPVIPVDIHKPMVFLVGRTRFREFIIQVYLNQLPQLISNIADPTMSLSMVNGIIDAADPCFIEYGNFEGVSSPIPGIYVSSNSILIWTAPMFYSSPYSTNGIPAYSDGNGTYYWDTCLVAGNTAYPIQSSSWYWLPINVLGYEDYLEKSTMYNNNGFIISQLGAINYYYSYEQYKAGLTNALVGDLNGGGFSINSWNPLPMSSVNNYGIFLGTGIEGFPLITDVFGISKAISISGSLNPSMFINIPGAMVQVPNVMWTFNIDQSGDGVGFPNAFEDITPAGVFISNSSFNVAVLNINFKNTVVTTLYPCAYETIQIIWVQITWSIIVITRSSTTISLPTLPISANTPPNTYVSKVTSYTVPILCLS